MSIIQNYPLLKDAIYTLREKTSQMKTLISSTVPNNLTINIQNKYTEFRQTYDSLKQTDSHEEFRTLLGQYYIFAVELTDSVSLLIADSNLGIDARVEYCNLPIINSHIPTLQQQIRNNNFG